MDFSCHRLVPLIPESTDGPVDVATLETRPAGTVLNVASLFPHSQWLLSVGLSKPTRQCEECSHLSARLITLSFLTAAFLLMRPKVGRPPRAANKAVGSVCSQKQTFYCICSFIYLSVYPTLSLLQFHLLVLLLLLCSAVCHSCVPVGCLG